MIRLRTRNAAHPSLTTTRVESGGTTRKIERAGWGRLNRRSIRGTSPEGPVLSENESTVMPAGRGFPEISFLLRIQNWE